MVVYFIFSICLFPHSSGGDPCPLESDLYPCTCTEELMGTNMTKIPQLTASLAPNPKRISRNGLIVPEFSRRTSSVFTTVRCIAPSSLNVLEEKLSTALYRKWVDKLIVSNLPPETGNTLTRLPDDWLNNVRIRLLEIKNSQLMEDFIMHLHQPLRFQRGSLHWLTVNNCSLAGSLTSGTIGTVQTQGLNYLSRLQGVDFSTNHLTAVMASAFRNPPPNLASIVLSQNNIEYFENAAFQNVLLLKHVDFSHNLLTSVNRDIFPLRASRLENIDISWNYIQSISQDFFRNMTALKSVNISYNFLHSLSSDSWQVVWNQLSFIDVSGNFIECDCDLYWLLPMLLTSNRSLEKDSEEMPKALPGQLLKGSCATPLYDPNMKTITYDLAILTKDEVSCYSVESGYGSGSESQLQYENPTYYEDAVSRWISVLEKV